MFYLSSITALFIVYLMLTANITLPNLVLGLLVATGITLLMPKDAPMLFRIDRLPRFLLTGMQYAFVVIWDVVLGGLMTARIVLSPRMPLKPGIIAIPSGSKTELGTAMSAHAITLSPGELVIEMDSDGMMYTHCLDVDATAAESANAQAKRQTLLDSIFEFETGRKIDYANHP